MSTPPRLGIAAGNELGARAAEEVARQGGNAVDACLASAVMGWVAEPFFTSIGGSGFVSVRSPGGEVEVIDGNNSMPHTIPAEPGQGIKRTYLDYSDGMYTGIGGGSVGIPGVLAAVRRAWERHGSIEWAALFAPAIRAARDGFAFPKTSAYYLSVTHKEIWSQYPGSAELFLRDGEPRQEGEHFVQPKLAEALSLIAEEGPTTFYKGTIGQALSDAIKADGGFMELDDLASYEAHVRQPIASESFGWRIDANPPPASGGASLVHLLAFLESAPQGDIADRLRAFVEAQRMTTLYGEGQDDPDTIAADEDEDAAVGRRRSPGSTGSPEGPPTGRRAPRSSATTHTSSADADGYACAITESNGYGSGLVVHGMLLNNTLGEEELNPLGMHGLQPGARCHSNQAPTIVTSPSRSMVVSLGSPGATRIVGAIAQTFLRIALDEMSLADAVAAPRAHLDPREEGDTLCFEPGLPGEVVEGFLLRPYDEIHMYFGAVQAASVTDLGEVDAAHDPRRSGASALI